MSETISVIIPYDDSITPNEQLEKAIESVNSQSIPTDVLIQREDGVAEARNTGLEAADTRYIAFLDGDDEWKPNKLERQLDELQRTSKGTCLCQSENFDGTVYDPVRNTEIDFVVDLFLNNITGFTSTILIDSQKVDAKFDTTLYRREDHAFILNAVDEAGVCFVPDILVNRLGRGLSYVEDRQKKLQAHREFYNFATDVYPELCQYYREYWHFVHKQAFITCRNESAGMAQIPHLVRALFYQPLWFKKLIILLIEKIRRG